MSSPFGERTRQALEWLNAVAGRTQQQAADMFGISQPTIAGAIARRRPTCSSCGQKLKGDAQPAMSIAEKIYEVAKPLPEPLALEALHFIEYLSSKNADRAEMSDLTRAQETVMKHVWDNQDDEVWNDVKAL